MKKILSFILITFALALAVRAQDEVPPPISAATFSSAQLDQLLGPIALYPDPLIAVLMPAATLPTEIVMADRYVSNGGDPNQMDTSSFDPNVIALAHYPSVLKWMDDNLNWTTQVGQAFQNQQQDVMDSVQRLRTDAYNLGNLQSTPQQQVVDDNGYIEIIPVSPDDLYVPDYQPDQVYYDQPDGAPYITFSVGFIIGPWLCCDFDWWHHRMIFWDHDHPRPINWWRQGSGQRQAYFSNWHGTVWNANNRPNVSGYHGGDRGWSQENRPDTSRGWSAPALNRPAPQPTERSEPNDRNDAFIGSQDARDTRSYSNRGAQSTGSESHSFGGGGGSRSSDSEVHSSAGGGGGGGFHGGGGGGGGFSGGGGGGGGRH
jgi:hypothetical protein